MISGQLVLAATGEIVSANLTTGDNRFFWIRNVEGDLHVVEEVQQVEGPRRNDSIPVPGGSASPASAAGPLKIPPGATERAIAGVPQIDVLVAYTTVARQNAGGTSAIQNHIQLAIAEANQGLVNSLVNLQFNLAGTLEVTFDDSQGLDVALMKITTPNDGVMDEIFAARASAHADLVSLWIHDRGVNANVVGTGWQLKDVSSTFARHAFSTVEQYWAAGPVYAFSHEMGHNMGAQHDRMNADSQGAYPYAYGFQNPNGSSSSRFRTIMAYPCLFTDCPAVNFWSNPSVKVKSVASGVDSSQPNSANNALTLNNTGATVAAFSEASLTCAYSLSPQTRTVDVGGTNGTLGLTTDFDCSWTATSNNAPWLTVTPGSGGTGGGLVSYAVAANTGAARGGTITVGGTAGGQSFTVNQAGVSGACAYTLSAAADSVAASGDIRAIRVGAGSGCAWTATSNAAWITVLSGATGSGAGAVRISIAANTATNTGTSRSGTVTIAGLTYTVTQNAAGCTFTLAGPAATLAATAAGYAITITTQASCQWSATSAGSWITMTSATSGTETGTLSFSVSANTGNVPRAATIVIAGQWLPFLQKPITPAAQFTDEPSTDIFFDYVNLIALNRVTTGCATPLTYCPADTMVRSEMAAFVIRALFGETFSFSQTPYFTDVPATHPKFAYIQKMRDLGITTGCGANAYCPDSPLSREQMAVFLVRARLGLSSTDTFLYQTAPYFSDMVASSVYFPFVQKMKEMGITAGCSATAYCGSDPNTRGQMAVFVTRGLF